MSEFRPDDWRDKEFVLSFAPNKFQNALHRTYKVRDLVDLYFSKHLIRHTKDSEGFSCELVDDTPLPKGKNLRNENAKQWPFLVYDLDQNQSYADASRFLRADGIAFFGYSSFSHMLAKDGGTPEARFRIIVFIKHGFVFASGDDAERKLSAEVYKRAYIAVASRYGLIWDKQCKNIARLFYLPAHNGSQESAANAFIDHEFYRTGAPLDFSKDVDAARSAILTEREQAEAKKKAHSERKAKAADRRKHYQTPGLGEFKERCGGSLDAKTFCCDHAPGARETATGAVEMICLNQIAHSDGADDRLTSFVFNAGEADANGRVQDKPYIGCNHETCTTTLATWDYIDLICVDAGLGVTDLLPYASDASRARFERNRGLPLGYERIGGRITGKTLGLNPITLDLCKDFTVGPRVHDENGTGWGTEIAFKNDSGADVTAVILGRDLQNDEAEVRAGLSDMSLQVATEPAARTLFSSLLNRLQPNGTRTNYSRPGWHDNAFVTAMGEVMPIGATEGCPGRLDQIRSAPVRAKSGSREVFNRLVLGNLHDQRLHHLLLGILIGCAGPFMKLLNLESRLLYLGGASKRGKTTTQELSVAVWASPKRGEGLLFPCKSTLNGLEALLARGRDQTTALDELRQMDERARQGLVFDLAAGCGKSRMKRNLEMQRTITWDAQVITLSGEQSAGQLLSADGPRVAGEVVRMPSIDVGTLPAHDDPRYVKAIAQAARDNFGWLGPDVVQTILKIGYRNDPTLLQTIYDGKLDLLVKSNAATQHESASVFALLWTVGEVLQKVNLLPSEWNIAAAVRWACDTFAQSSEAGLMDPRQTARDALFTYLITNPSKFPFARTGRALQSGYLPLDGWRDADVYFVLVNVFERVVGKHTNTLSFKRYAAEQGFLQTSGKNYTHQRIPEIGYHQHVRIVLPTDASVAAANDDVGGTSNENLVRAAWRFRHRRRA